MHPRFSKHSCQCSGSQGGTGSWGSHHSECVLFSKSPCFQWSILALSSVWHSSVWDLSDQLPPKSQSSSSTRRVEGTISQRDISRSTISFHCIVAFRGTSCCQFLSLCEVLQYKSGYFWVSPVNLNFSFMGLHRPSPLHHLHSISQNVIVFFPFLLLLQPILLLSF